MLTKKQEILDFLKKFHNKAKFSIGAAQIAEKTKINKGTVYSCLKSLEKENQIIRLPTSKKNKFEYIAICEPVIENTVKSKNFGFIPLGFVGSSSKEKMYKDSLGFTRLR